MFHHFVVLDDVISIDTNGVPRNEDGIAVEILEYSNTASQFLAEASKRGFVANILDKAKCRRVALVDYGDNAYFYRFKDDASNDDKRELIIQRAMEFIRLQPRYHVIRHNCEHAANLITMKNHNKSHLIDYVFSNGKRHIFHVILSLMTLLFDEIGWIIRTPVAYMHVCAIQSCILKPLMRQKNFTILEFLRFIFVSIFAYISIDTITQSDQVHPIVKCVTIPNVFWFSDTIIFNTVVNVYALLAFSISS
jgi:hypothetical protein